jgi:hypothetical protein
LNELRMIEGILSLEAELQARTFGNLNRFREAWNVPGQTGHRSGHDPSAGAGRAVK